MLALVENLPGAEQISFPGHLAVVIDKTVADLQQADIVRGGVVDEGKLDISREIAKQHLAIPQFVDVKPSAVCSAVCFASFSGAAVHFIKKYQLPYPLDLLAVSPDLDDLEAPARVLIDFTAGTGADRKGQDRGIRTEVDLGNQGRFSGIECGTGRKCSWKQDKDQKQSQGLTRNFCPVAHLVSPKSLPSVAQWQSYKLGHKQGHKQGRSVIQSVPTIYGKVITG